MLLSSSARSATLFTAIATATRILQPTCPATSIIANQCSARFLHTSTRYQSGTPLQLIQKLKIRSLVIPTTFNTRGMASSSSSDPVINNILDYWFALDAKGWFMVSAEQDRTITERFGSLVDKARLTDELDSWTDTAAGSLAYIILLDQFTRNIFRPGNHPEPGLSWSGDAKALRIAADTISKGFDRQIMEEHASSPMMGFAHRFFTYMPYMHAEDIHCQVASCALFDTLGLEFELMRVKKGRTEENEAEKTLKYMIDSARSMAVKHRDCIVEVGRFPKRNEPLGRDTSVAEKRFLEEHPDGF